MRNNFTLNTRYRITRADGRPIRHPSISAHQWNLQSFAEAKHRLADLIDLKAVSRGQAQVVKITEEGDWVPVHWAEPIDAAMASRAGG
jgi:hypothetical protein